jgi:hypothetical protein
MEVVMRIPFFGAMFAVVPQLGSTAILPHPALNVSNQPGEGFVILFPNGTSLATDSDLGAMRMSSDGRIISNSLDPDIQPHAWTAAGPEALEDAALSVHDWETTNYNCITSSSWSFTLSAL